MLHALYFDKDSDGGSRTVLYKNKHVETETFKVEKRRNKPSFIPAIDGSPPAIFLAYMFNMVSMLILNLFPFFRSIILKHFFKVSWFASQVFLKFLWLGATKKLKKK